MPIVFLEPRDLNGVQAQQVLDFLNRADSAKQLARDIEFPNEPDIGVRLGQRLLDARAALGGRFTAITQVRAVRLIGPERFTEICVAALGLDPRRWGELFYGAAPAALPTETGLGLSIDALPQPAWLGQPLALTVRVADQGGTPRAGIAVTVQAGAGRLVWMYGFQRVEGQAVTVLSGADGSAVLELRRDASEPLTEEQDAVLQTALQSLDAAAPDPFKVEAGMRELADQYLRERAYALRGAIDIFVRDHRDAMLAGFNAGTWRMRWPIDSVLVQADAVAPGAGGSAMARAVITVTWKNWVGAWLEFFGDLLREGAALDKRFDQALERDAGAEVVGGLLGEAQRFVANQSGRAAQWLGQKTIDAAVNQLVGSDRLANVDDATRAAVLTQLEVASREVSPTSLGNFTLVSRVRKDLGGKLGDIGVLGLERLNRAEAVLAEVDRKAALVDSRAADVERKSAAIDGSLVRFNADLADFNRNRLTLDSRITTLSTSVTTLRQDFGRLQLPRAAPPARGGTGEVAQPDAPAAIGATKSPAKTAVKRTRRPAAKKAGP